MSSTTISPTRKAGVSLVQDAYHLGMAGYYTFRLLLDNKAVTNTYGYNAHLEQVSFVDRRFRRWLLENPAVIEALREPLQSSRRQYAVSMVSPARSPSPHTGSLITFRARPLTP